MTQGEFGDWYPGRGIAEETKIEDVADRPTEP